MESVKSKLKESSDEEPQDGILFNALTVPQICIEQADRGNPIVIEEIDSKNGNSRTNSP